MYGHQSVRSLPPAYPQFFARAAGSQLWDVDGNAYVDLMCAYGPTLLGYGHTRVDDAFRAQLARGDTMNGPSARIVELAERLVELLPGAAWALFAKNGTDVTTAALTIARAATGRRKILVATGSYHGAAPWCTPLPSGTVDEARAHLLHFAYGDLTSLAKAADAAGDDLAAVLVTPFRHDALHDQTEPDAGFARGVRALCDARGALLLMDEVRAGLRLAFGGSWSGFGVEPDLAAWGKSLANGHPIAALTGGERVREAASRVYLTGSFWFQAAPMAAALVTLDELAAAPYVEELERLGRRLREGWQQQADRHGVGIRQTGPVQMPLLLFDDDPKLRKGNRWAALAVEGGAYVHPWHNMFLSLAHTEDDIDRVLQATDPAFAAVAREGEEGSTPGT